jgi:hypothetical protein
MKRNPVYSLIGIMFFAVLFGLFGGIENNSSRYTAYAETYNLSGTNISLTVPAEDTVLAVEARIDTHIANFQGTEITHYTAVKAVIDNIHDTDLPAAQTVIDDIHDTDLPAVTTDLTAIVYTTLESLESNLTNYTGKTIFEKAYDMYTPLPSLAINNSVNVTPSVLINLDGADIQYELRNLRFKAPDPGANTITLTLYELINDTLTEVDTFDITTANYTVYYTLVSLFELDYVAGDRILIMMQTDADAYTVTGQYTYWKNK